MIRGSKLAKRVQLGRLSLYPLQGFCTAQSGGDQQQSETLNISHKFVGYVTPVVFPTWLSSPIIVKLPPKLSDFVKDQSPTQLGTLAYAPHVKQFDNNLPLEGQFYSQATLCNIISSKNNQFSLEPTKKVKITSIKVELYEQSKPEEPDIVPAYKLPTVSLRPSAPGAEDSLGKLDQADQTKERTYVLYKVQGDIMQAPKVTISLQNDMKYKKFMYFTYMSTKISYQLNGNHFDPSTLNIFQAQSINLQQVMDKTMSLMEPFIFATQLRNKSMFPHMGIYLKSIFQAKTIEDRLSRDVNMAHFNYVVNSLFQQMTANVTNDQRKRGLQMQSQLMLQDAREALDGKLGKMGFIARVRQQFATNNPSEQMSKAFEEECAKYLEQEDNQSGNTKEYIQTLSTIPYDVQAEEVFDTEKAMAILDGKHYGMKEVKDYIMEFIAVGKLKGTQKGKVLCFIGPPGVGKTTFAESVAEALGRRFESISLGGVVDSTTLKGHRRTYVNSYPGKIIEALRRCKTSNPVILLDQIDKMGSSGHHGDPRSDLLEILDPNQNFSFVDNYVDHPVDLSNVLFICSANYIEKLSQPLLDRLQKVELTSYTDQEKMQIASRHILPKVIGQSGVAQGDYVLDSDVVMDVINKYTHGEAGVRYLEKLLRKIFQKIAVKIAEGKQARPVRVSCENLSDYLDQADKQKVDYTKLGVGVAVGLGESEVQGGRVTIIQVVQRSYKNEGKLEGLSKTGNLGQVLKQSVDIAYTFAKRFLRQKFGNTYLYQNEIHLHAPEGHSKKNGAGQSLTIACALVSLALKKIPKRGIAVAGELSLHGRIMPVSNLKEKLLTAKREKIYEVVLPLENREEVGKFLGVVTDGLQFHFVQTFDEVEKILFQ